MDKEYYEALYNLERDFNPEGITTEDIKIADEVASKILSIGRNKCSLDKQELDLLRLLNSVAPIFYQIGCIEAANNTYSILSNINYQIVDNSEPHLFSTYAEAIGDNGMIAKKTVTIAVPSIVNNISSVFMAHEVSHALKEQNPFECQLIYRLNEMIPMLIELIAAYKSDRLTFNEIINSRFDLLFNAAYYYQKIKKELDKFKDKKIPNYLYSALGNTVVYLNSFYYTVAFFNTYLDYPDVIIRYINLVLNNTLSTKEVINSSIRIGLIENFLEEFNNGLDFIQKK